MDLDDFKGVMGSLGLDLWTLIETAISLAARDHGRELRARRDGFVEQLYAAPAAAPCQSRHSEDGPARPGATRAGERERSQSRCTEEERQKLGSSERNRGASPSMALSPDREEEDDDEAAAAAEEEEEEGDRDRRRHSRPVEDEQTKILAIKDLLDDPDQPEDDLVHLLQVLADMDITFRALKGTDIGRHVNGLRKHPSSEVRRLVKQLVRKWKDLVDEWVKSNSHETATPSIITDGDSPQQIQARAGQSRNQVVFGNQNPDVNFSYLPLLPLKTLQTILISLLPLCGWTTDCRFLILVTPPTPTPCIRHHQTSTAAWVRINPTGRWWNRRRRQPHPHGRKLQRSPTIHPPLLLQLRRSSAGSTRTACSTRRGSPRPGAGSTRTTRKPRTPRSSGRYR
uniref:Transcription elongation factor A N-terminal and central domain-containing protein 2 n=1 Tax=Anthurium amnicola TaxID=1678845 RepID=A0A1D1YR09_9ARAE